MMAYSFVSSQRAGALALLLVGLAGSTAAQTPHPPEDPPDLTVLSYSFKTKYVMDVQQNYPTHIEQYNADVHGKGKISWVKVPIYQYRAFVKNTGTKEIQSIDWTYVFVFDQMGSLVE